MTDIFLSYARQDRKCAELLAGELTSRGWSVWWDREILFGHTFSKVIQSEIDQARCIIVLWSRSAIASGWVEDEANAAKARGILVPIRIEDVVPPLGFRSLQTAELFDWTRGFNGPEFERCLESIECLVPKGEGPADSPTAQPEHPSDPREGFWISDAGQLSLAPDLATLRAWAEEGRLKADGHVYDPIVQRWISALEIPGLRDALQTTEPQAGSGSPAAMSAFAPPKPKRAGRPVFKIAGILAGLVGVLLMIGMMARKHESPAVTGTAVTTATTMTDTSARTTSDTSATTMTSASGSSPVQASLTGTNTQSISVSLKNCYDKSISVAITYLNGSNQWSSTGWYQVPAKSTRSNVLSVVGPVIYFYADSADKTSWEGEESDPIRMQAQVDYPGPFDSAMNQINGKDVRPVSFFGRKVDPGRDTYTQEFECK